MSIKILGVGPRTAEFLRTRYPRPRAKLIAREFGVSEGTAERWLRGEAPTVAHIEQMTAIFGEDYLRAVFVEAYERQDQRIGLLERAMEAAILVGGFAGGAFEKARSLGISVTPRMFAGWIQWAGIRLGLAQDHPVLQLAHDETRTALIEGLMTTVPLIEGPATRPNAGS